MRHYAATTRNTSIKCEYIAYITSDIIARTMIAYAYTKGSAPGYQALVQLSKI